VNSDAPAQRQTRQREVILEVIRGAEGPLSVASILERCRERVPRLGLATVYRTIGLLREVGSIIEVLLPGEDAHFEPAHRGHHHHFCCRSCHRVFELETCPVGIPAGSVLPGGFRVEDHHLTLYGLCAACAVRPNGVLSSDARSLGGP
jgi:Fur family transcriptional regulator, ferric uptake regulator